MRWAGRVAFLVEGRVAYIVLVGKFEGQTPLGKLDVDGKIILKRNLCEKRLRIMAWTDLYENRGKF